MAVNEKRFTVHMYECTPVVTPDNQHTLNYVNYAGLCLGDARAFARDKASKLDRLEVYGVLLVSGDWPKPQGDAYIIVREQDQTDQLCQCMNRACNPTL